MEPGSSTLLTLLITLSWFHLAESLGTGLGLSPHMGWSSWNVKQCDSASAKYALDAADKFISLGLKDLGYEYINIDDCWSTKERDGSGKLVPDPVKWPNGIKAVADRIHDMGLKFGLYGCAGQMTCAEFPGSEGYAVSDVDQLVGWGVDFWKFDNCYTPCKVNPRPQTCPDPAGNTKTWYAPMRDAILAARARTASQIHFNLCNWGRDEVYKWGAQYGAQSWRISEDNYGDWASIERIASTAADITQYSGPGGFNDLDMLYLGSPKLNTRQERLHFGLWAILKSPLVLGLDLSNISASTLEIVTNRGIIEINQDPLGKPANTFRPPGGPEPVKGKIYPYWVGELKDGVVIGLCAGTAAGRYSLEFRDVPGLGRGWYEWTEMYTAQTGWGSGVSLDIGLHDMRVVKVGSFIFSTSNIPSRLSGPAGKRDY
ncbi:glycoside hydrolase family 27 protein [Parathielavia appendiculata]|uniref:Alpha-galactosidase n=1 Tax=Parathielavia appendiculata TaxID=2587402 RepID=A0AAN6YZY2_9PEZI|nr:glycoside hydrolase family 27 protein [Parathielavia appendiculata]